MDAFLAFECGISTLERLAVSYYEFRVLEHGWKAQRESEERLVRTQCFYAIAPHRDKKSPIKKPEDLWAIGDEVEETKALAKVRKQKQSQINKSLKRGCAKLGVKLNII